MIPRIAELKVMEGYRLWIRFHDGSAGTVDLSGELWGPMFEPLRDKNLFSQASVHPELNTVTWPNGADFSPEFLFEAAQPRLATDTPETANR